MLRTWTRQLAGRRAWLAGAAALGVMAVASWPGFSAGDLGASQHRGSPLVSGDPTTNHTDLYAFVSPDRPDTVTLVASWLPSGQPGRGRGFATDAHYDIHIDNDGDGAADLTYRWTFQDVDPASHDQRYTLAAIGPQRSTALVVASPVADSTAVPAGQRAEWAVARFPGGQAFAGQADDPAFFDERVFDVLYGEPPAGDGRDAVAGDNVQTVAVQVPKAALALRGDPGRNPVVGVWSTTAKRTLALARGPADSDVVPVSRLGNPLFTEMIGAADLGDAFRRASPAEDSRHTALMHRVAAPPTAQRVAASYGLEAPLAPRRDLAELFLTGFAADASPPSPRPGLNAHVLNADADRSAIRPAEELRLNLAVPVTATPHRLGLLARDRQGFPNGRRLGDDVVDIELQALAGAWTAGAPGTPVSALTAGDRVDGNDTAFGPRFPYVAPPHTTAGRAAPADDVAAAAPLSDGWLALASGLGAVALLAGGLAVGWWYSRSAPGRYAVSR